MHSPTGGGAKTSDTAVSMSSSTFVEFFEHRVFGRSVQTYRNDDAETEVLIVDFERLLASCHNHAADEDFLLLLFFRTPIGILDASLGLKTSFPRLARSYILSISYIYLCNRMYMQRLLDFHSVVFTAVFCSPCCALPPTGHTSCFFL